MCGRFNMTTDPLTRLFMALVGQAFPGPDRLNVAPTESVPVVAAEAGERFLAEMRWWLVPSWSKAPSTRYAMFNARAENLTHSNAFRGPFARRRCIVPVSGFFEWITDPDGRKTPHYVVPDGGDGLLLAGLWDRWSGDDTQLESFTLVTTAAHRSLRWLHDRQPVLLTDGEADRWLDPDAPEDQLLALCASRIAVPIAAAPMSPRINNARFKGPECLVPEGPPRHMDAAPGAAPDVGD
ncbi:MAG TPA: SOS response-associated peptidase [Pseudomonadales bacterium]|nr:SOS response-associated peptidase [Pseudomonadales bacterium]